MLGRNTKLRLGLAGMVAAFAAAYAPPLSRTLKRHWPEELRRKRPDAQLQQAAHAKRERRKACVLRHVAAGGYLRHD